MPELKFFIGQFQWHNIWFLGCLWSGLSGPFLFCTCQWSDFSGPFHAGCWLLCSIFGGCTTGDGQGGPGAWANDKDVTSHMTSQCDIMWHHIWYHTVMSHVMSHMIWKNECDITYDVSLCCLWFHMWYHSLFAMISHNCDITLWYHNVTSHVICSYITWYTYMTSYMIS